MKTRIISCLPTHVINLVINDNSLEILYIYIYIYIFFFYLFIYFFFYFFFFPQAMYTFVLQVTPT